MQPWKVLPLVAARALDNEIGLRRLLPPSIFLTCNPNVLTNLFGEAGSFWGGRRSRRKNGEVWGSLGAVGEEWEHNLRKYSGRVLLWPS